MATRIISIKKFDKVSNRRTGSQSKKNEQEISHHTSNMQSQALISPRYGSKNQSKMANYSYLPQIATMMKQPSGTKQVIKIQFQKKSKNSSSRSPERKKKGKLAIKASILSDADDD
jgi:hypothetical protein